MEPQQILRILRRRAWKVVCWAVVLGLIVGAASHYREKPVYQTGAQVLLEPNNSAQPLTQQSTTQIDPATYAASQETVVRSLTVAQAASALMPGHPSPALLLGQISVAINPTTGVLTIIATSGDRAEAQEAANAFAKAYVANSYANALGNLKSAVTGIQPQLDAMQRQIASLDNEIVYASKAKGTTATVTALTEQRVAVQNQYAALFASQETLRVSIELTRAQAEIVAVAGLPGTPISPKPLEDAALAATAGLLIGLGIELLREKFDDKMNTAEDVEQITGHPLIAQIPKDDAVGTASPVVVRPGEFSEAIRALRTGLQFLGVDHPVRRIVVSSAGNGDGKTTVAAHLAVAYAEAGFVTTLVSADLRRPRVESLFGSTNVGLGLSSLLATGPLRPRTAPHVNADGNLISSGSPNGNGSANGNGNGNGNGVRTNGRTDDKAFSQHSANMSEFLHLLAVNTAIENLTVIPAGPTPPNPAELLGSTRMREALDALAEHADVIIIDTPPALVVTDSVVLADASDGVLLVMSADKSTSRDLKRLMAVFETADVPVLGTVLNRARSRGRNEYYTAYKTPSQPVRMSRRERRKEAKASA